MPTPSPHHSSHLVVLVIGGFVRQIQRLVLLLPLLLVMASSAYAATPLPPGDVRAANVDLIREQQAEHIGTLGYIWGFPMVDMSTQMFNETHRVAPAQPVLAPVNTFHRREFLVTPSSSEGLRAPNNDTLYLSGWFDLSQGPVIVHAPDTAGRYYTLAVTDFFNEVTHLGRRTTGTAARDFALVGPGWKGTLPTGVMAVPVKTKQAWILGRLLVDGEADFPVALGLLREFRAAPLSAWEKAGTFTPPEPAAAPRLEPRESSEFFAVLNAWLRENATPADEGALMALFDRAGFGPGVQFDAAALDPATRRGLEKGISNARAMLRAAGNVPLPDVRNGWIFPLGLADYGHDYLSRAAVAAGGYANRPEESTYAARTVDDAGQPMTGAQRYHLHFRPEHIPPAGAFWSLSAYDALTRNLIENPIRRYSIGDRTRGLRKNADGSLDIHISRERPADGASNWLPVGEGPFYLVVRIYEPGPAVFDGSYALPPLRPEP